MLDRLLATRQQAVKQGLLSKASFDAGLALSHAMTRLQPAVAAKGAVDGLVQETAAIAAQQLFFALQRETADDKNFKITPTNWMRSAAWPGQIGLRLCTQRVMSCTMRLLFSGIF